MTYFELFLAVAAVGTVFAVLAWLADRGMDRPVDLPPRPDRHLPADEYALLGDDYRDRVAPFFNRRFESDERVAHAIHHACFTKKEAPARVESPGATTPSKELTHARSANK